MAYSFKRVLEQTSPETNSPKRSLHLTASVMPNPAVASAAAKMPDVFSWSKLKLILQESLDVQLKDVAKKQDILAVNACVAELMAENENLRSELSSLRSRLETIDHASRRCNLVVKGLACANSVSAAVEFVKLAKDVLKIDISVIESRNLPLQGAFMFKLGTQEQADNVFKAKKCLKGSAIFVDKDYTQEESNKKYNLRMLAKNLSNVQDLKIRMGLKSIYINDKAYSWFDGKIVAERDTDAQMLRDVLVKANCSVEVCLRPRKSRLSETKNHSTRKRMSADNSAVPMRSSAGTNKSSTHMRFSDVTNNSTTRMHSPADSNYSTGMHDVASSSNSSAHPITLVDSNSNVTRA